MTASTDPKDAFAERLRLQVESRYHGVDVAVDRRRFGLHVTAAGIDVMLPLTPLFNSCERNPAGTPALIADFVRSIDRRLTPRTGDEFAIGRVLWCVRSNAYLRDMARRDELLTRDLGGDLVAFVAEELPNAVMRGVPAATWRDAGHADDAIQAAAEAATHKRFSSLVERIAATDRIPGDGWRLSSDVLYQGSVLLVAAVMQAFVERCDCDVLVANPDRSMVLALPTNQPSAHNFPMRATREWREAMNPASREVFVATRDGSLRVVPRKRGGVLMPWLAE